jgi:5-methyltetrahydropteroyltriglutamate--homocysteine methyltransferase
VAFTAPTLPCPGLDLGDILGTMQLPTEPIGSIPRPPELIHAVREVQEGRLAERELEDLYRQALRDTIQRFEATGSPVITDGEQTKPSFATYPIHGSDNLAPDGVKIPFADGHFRQLPRLASGPFRYRTHAETYLLAAKGYTQKPVKQAVISASALSLLYPQGGIPGYSQEEFIADLIREAEADIRGCLERGAHNVQIDFTEGRLAVKLDPSGGLLRQFIDLNNQVLNRFTPEERRRIGVHTCPGGDQDSTHSADVDYADLLPGLFSLAAGNFYLQLASEPDRRRVLAIIRENAKPEQRIFIGVTDPIDPRVETPEEVRDRALEAAEFIAPERLGTTDDCGFSPFGDDTSTARDTAFAKIRARVIGTELASRELGS